MLARLRRHPLVALAPAVWGVLLWLGISTRQWFYADEWEYVINRFRPADGSISGLLHAYLAPHNEHWTTIPILVLRAVFGVVGLRAYWPYLAVTLAVHVAIGLLLGRRLRHELVPDAIAVPLVLVFWFLGVGSENVWWSFQLGWTCSMLAGLVVLELADRDAVDRHAGALHVRHLAPLWLVTVLGLMSSGNGIAMAVVAAVALLARRGWRDAARFTVVPAAVQLVWMATYGRDAGIGKGSGSAIDWSEVPYRLAPYAWRSVTHTLEGITGLRGSGPILTVVLLAALAVSWPRLWRDHDSVLAMAVGVPVFLALVGVGRIALDQPEASRYSYSVWLLLVPAIGVLLRDALAPASVDGRRDRRRTVPAVIAAILAVVWSAGSLAAAAQDEGKIEGRAREEVAAAFALASAGFSAPEAVPQPETPDLTVAAVHRLIAAGIRPGGHVSDVTLAMVAARTSVDVTAEPRVSLDSSSFRIAGVARAIAEPVESGCISMRPVANLPQLALLPQRPASIKVVPLVKGTLLVTVQRNGVIAPPLQVPVAANNPVFVNIADPRNQYFIGVPPDGMTKLCGIGQALPG